MGLDNPTHWIYIIVLLLLIFGARRLPEIGRSLGSGLREFKQSVTGESPQPALPATTAEQPLPPREPEPTQSRPQASSRSDEPTP